MYNRMNFLDLIELYDDTLFEGVNFPTGIASELLIDHLVDECAIYEPIYTEYALFNRKIKTFFRKNNANYEKMIDALNTEYKPLENYNKTLDRTEDRATAEKDERSVSENRTSSEDSKSNISAFNSSSYVPSSEDYTNGNLKTNSEDDRNALTNDEFKIGERAYGNIGVTTSQQMLESEIKLRKEINIFNIIGIDFIKEFFIRIV